jgi:predicted enzyme related to lactoylglutathione lyase
MYGNVSFLELGANGSDTAKSQAFFETVFGWPFQAMPQGGGWFQAPQIRVGLHGNDTEPQMYVFFDVGDLEQAITVVRDAGGEAEPPTSAPGFGRFSNCRDPQGIRFGLHQTGSAVSRINFVELPASNLQASRRFYSDAFGLAFTDFGPTYSCTMTGDVDLGLQADAAEATATPLAVIAVDDLEKTLDSVRQAGGTITRDPFAFPGGRRFHFRDPSGNEVAALKIE